ncbi:hypothetical protein VNI00_017458 [Paramarasmius palmivorus]|uniref:O-methyltransferase dimerisation domain-containing protein n=1 Tax=Paramarasmius palmivorus TaxID=297713 RepID=A0AAW0B5H0_9AGAR
MEAKHLTDLTSLIASSVQEIISTYASVGERISTLDSVEPGLFDSIAMDEVPEKITRAIQVVEAACTRLVYSVSRPGTILLSKAKAQMEVACLSAVLNAGIPDLLLDKAEGMHVQLAEMSRFTAGADRLERVMRFLASKHVFRQVKPGVYAHNRLSIKLISREPVSDVVAVSQDYLPASTRLCQALIMPDGYNESAFKQATGYGRFEYIGLPENKDKEEVWMPSSTFGVLNLVSSDFNVRWSDGTKFLALDISPKCIPGPHNLRDYYM